MTPIPDLIYFCLRCHIPSLSTFHWYHLSFQTASLPFLPTGPSLYCFAQPNLSLSDFLQCCIPLSLSLSFSFSFLASSLINHCVPQSQPRKNTDFIFISSCCILAFGFQPNCTGFSFKLVSSVPVITFVGVCREQRTETGNVEYTFSFEL